MSPLPLIPGGGAFGGTSGRDLSGPARQSIYAQETGEIWLHLLEIEHTAITTLRFVDNTEQITSNGDIYLPYAFRIALPGEFDDQLPSVQLEIDNVDRQILEGIRALPSAPTIVLALILASSPDVIEAGPFRFTLKAVDYDAQTISGTLAFEDTLNEPYPAIRFTPNYFPGIFP
jgi:hypothetical protein